jgi:RNA polymerase sigma factor (sigma-70 family)
MNPETEQKSELSARFFAVAEELFAECIERAPNFGVDQASFVESLDKSTRKFLIVPSNSVVTDDEIEKFLRSIKTEELFLAISCANGNERAWWEFDHQHRTYLERVARHLASSELNAQEVVDRVYVELYGTRIVDGQRMSKFANYSGKGSIRGWLRTVIWHSLVDLHRASHDEVSLDEMTENVGEGHAHSNFAETDLGGEEQMLDEIARERYRKATVSSIQDAFTELDPHEKLLLLYYHAENLKLREIARLVEKPNSPLRAWFQRKSSTRKNNPASKIHESTIMRWLEKTYKIVLKSFSEKLKLRHGLDEDEVAICLELATQDLANPDIYENLAAGI